MSQNQKFNRQGAGMGNAQVKKSEESSQMANSATNKNKEAARMNKIRRANNRHSAGRVTRNANPGMGVQPVQVDGGVPQSPSPSPVRGVTSRHIKTPVYRKMREEASLKAEVSGIPQGVGDLESYPIVCSDSTSFSNAYAITVASPRRLFSDPQVEAQLVNFSRCSVKALTESRDAKAALDEGMAIYREYDRHLSFSENVLGGLATRYRIQEGQFLIRLKELVKEAKMKWTQFLGENYPQKNYRVIRQYIQLAETSRIDHYAPLGKELLVKLIAELKRSNQLKGDDPIGKFLEKHQIEYDPEKDHGPEHLDLMHSIRVAVNYQRIMDADLQNSVSRDQVERLVTQGKIVTQSLVDELRAVKGQGNDIAQHMDAIVNDGGKLQGVKRQEPKAPETRDVLSRISQLIDEMVSNPNGLNESALEDIFRIEEKISTFINRLEAEMEEGGEGDSEAIEMDASAQVEEEPDEDGDDDDEGGDAEDGDDDDGDDDDDDDDDDDEDGDEPHPVPDDSQETEE